MESVRTSIESISELEARLGALVQESLVKADYLNAKYILDALAKISEARIDLQGKRDSKKEALNVSSEILASSTSNFPQVSESLRLGRKLKLPDFPQFERESDRLIKIGWSAKEKRTYEHRISHQSVFEICQFMADHLKPRKPFKVDIIVDAKTKSGNGIPGYQVYLVLNWLQHFGALERKGRDGYILSASLQVEAVNKIWQQTPERTSS